MKHIDFSPTPVRKLNYFSERFDCNIFAKRDDLFPEAGGGNKARMLQYILADTTKENVDVIITAGGPCSNFNRACALMCAKLGVAMHLVEYSDVAHEFDTSLNYYLCNLANVRTTRCEKTDVPDTVKKVIDSYIDKNVKFVYGGGKSLEGIFSYYEAVSELKSQIDDIDYVFISCGTGTTVTGVCAGFQEFYPNSIVHAVSVARTYDVEKHVLEEDMKSLNDYLKKSLTFDNMIFHEDFLCGGYSCTTLDLLKCIKECISNEGMIVDPCYSGKSFWGMCEIISNNLDVFRGKNVLFWNTGGLLNLLSMKHVYGV